MLSHILKGKLMPKHHIRIKKFRDFSSMELQIRKQILAAVS
jgi:hypothetical protein